MSTRFISVLAFFLFTASPAFGDLLTGRVVNEFGVGIPNVRIDVESLTGPNPDVMNDLTDLNGNFAATVPAGFYDVEILPPAPPLTQYMARRIDEVVLAGTVNLGTIALETGLTLSGRLVDTFGAAVVGVDLDVVDETAGEEIFVVNDNSDLLGNFTLVVPDELTLQIDPSTISPLLPTLAPQALRLSLAGNTNLGDTTLGPGFELTGIVINSLGFPVPDADFDFEFVPTGQEIYTPGDNSDPFGLFSLVVPGGLYDVQTCPPNGTNLVSILSPNFLVNADINVGIIVLPVGVTVSGTVTNCFGNPVASVDVDVRNATTGADQVLCGDRTDASGFYSVNVPVGLWNIEYTQAPGVSSEFTNVNLVSNTTLNASLACCAPGFSISRNGAGVNPQILTGPVPLVGTPWTATVNATGYEPGNLIILFAISLPGSGAFTPVGEALFHPAGILYFSRFAFHSGGPTNITIPIPPNTAFCGLQTTIQTLVLGDTVAQLTNALDLQVGS